MEGTVVEDETDYKVNLAIDGWTKDVFYPACFLELVTPVEALEPYSVSEATFQYSVKEDNKKIVAQFCKLYHPNAKAAAEAECKRLNEEWQTLVCRSEEGKEENNG